MIYSKEYELCKKIIDKATFIDSTGYFGYIIAGNLAIYCHKDMRVNLGFFEKRRPTTYDISWNDMIVPNLSLSEKCDLYKLAGDTKRVLDHEIKRKKVEDFYKLGEEDDK